MWHNDIEIFRNSSDVCNIKCSTNYFNLLFIHLKFIIAHLHMEAELRLQTFHLPLAYIEIGRCTNKVNILIIFYPQSFQIVCSQIILWIFIGWSMWFDVTWFDTIFAWYEQLECSLWNSFQLNIWAAISSHFDEIDIAVPFSFYHRYTICIGTVSCRAIWNFEKQP